VATNTYREKLLSIGVVSKRSKPHVVEGRDHEGNRVKATTDEAGNTITEHNNSKDQVDVTIRAPRIHVSTKEVPHNG
jgi:hypothetical protein